ncbi:MAG: sulfite exporter TauE/SafE family protein [Promethearchaeota archaeon]
MEWGFLLLFLFLSVIVGAIIGFGDSLIFIPLAGLLLGMRTAVVIGTFWTVFMLGLNAWKYRREIDWKFLRINLMAGVPGVIVGALSITLISLRWIELVLGVFIVIFTVIKITEWQKNDKLLGDSEDSSINRAETQVPVDNSAVGRPLLIGGSFTYGVFGGLIGAAGPVNVMLLKATYHQRENFIATFAISALVLNFIKISIYLSQGLFPVEHLWVYLVGILVIYLGTSLGHFITPKIPIRKLEIVILGLLLFIGFRSIATTTIFWSP